MNDFDITEAMIQFGGSFAQNLGKTWRIADETNRQKLKGTFGELWTQYAELAALKARQANV